MTLLSLLWTMIQSSVLYLTAPIEKNWCSMYTLAYDAQFDGTMAKKLRENETILAVMELK